MSQNKNLEIDAVSNGFYLVAVHDQGVSMFDLLNRYFYAGKFGRLIKNC